MPNHHHPLLHEPRDPQFANPPYTTHTIWSTVTHTPSASSVVPAGNGHPTSWGSVGAPLTGSRSSSSSKPTPPVRHQRPTQSQSSHHAVNSKPHHHHHQHSSHEKSSATHHKSTHSVKWDKSSSATGAAKTSQDLAPAAHRHGRPGSLHKSVQDQGMSSGAKAGLTIGLLLAFALVGAVIFFLYRRKKSQNDAHQPLDDEKSNLHNPQRSIPSHVSVRRTVANAPRLSLRPVTEMFPAMSEKQDNSSVTTLVAHSATSPRVKTPEPGMTAQAHPSAATNPFGDDAAVSNDIDQTNLTAPAAVVPKPLSVKSERTGSALSDRSPPDGKAFPAPAARRLSPPGPGPNNVHRVQLDFNPSMDDELGLRAGQLVRMLHEYDDGWALCIRLDRSQQGVVPRTCISKLPVKPRPQGPPPNMRGPPPKGRPRGPSNGTGPQGHPNDTWQRSVAPANGRIRSQSNAPRQHRPQSPGPFGGQAAVSQARPRANSDAMSARRITPPSVSPPSSTATSPTQGNSVPNRKPVPGQAL